MGKRFILSKKKLMNLYLVQKLNTYQIAEKVGCCQATIWKNLKEYSIKIRKSQELRSNVPTKNILKELYLNQKLSTWKIEKEYGYSRGTIHRKLKEYGLKTRDRSISHIIKIKKDFSKNLIEKAYLIGFRIGDLGVRKVYPNSRILVVACSSTHKAQIDLLNNLFSKYCDPWIKKDNNRIHFQVNLNESFNFLLSKKAPSWILKKDSYFFSFLAGFVDAEGHIKIYNHQAMFSVGNYDLNLLKFISKNLLEKGIWNKVYTDNRKGKLNNQGYSYNQNYSRLSVYRKEDLLNLFLKIKNYIKHEEKIEDLKKAQNNILERNLKMKNETFYVTTPVYYANGPPHLGGAYTTVLADILARWNRLQKKEVFFLTGTDEHGQKIQEIAEEVGKKPKEFVDEIVSDWKKAFKLLHISNDYFIRTTDSEHEKEVQQMLQTLFDRGLIYKSNYESYYCVGCEQYLTKKDLVDGKCSLHNRKPELKKEEAYLFKLSKFQDELARLIRNGDYNITPKKRRKEILTFIESGLEDVSISRLKEKISWGIELPFDKNHCSWVWPDAFWNYISGLKINKKFDKFWPVDVQLMAKDILRVHATIWPALLLGLNLPLPKTLAIHGYFTINGKKMSKSLGNVIDPIRLVEDYGADSVRYFLARNIPFGEDGDVSIKTLVERHNSELANKLGNLVSRVASLVEKNGLEKTENKLIKEIKLSNIEKLIDKYELDKALNEIFAFIDKCNEYIQDKKPWESRDKKVLYELVDSIKAVAILLWPFIPEASSKIAKQFGFEITYENIKKPLDYNSIKKQDALFERLEFKIEEKVGENKEEQKIEGTMTMDEIQYNDFTKLELKVGTIRGVEDIEGADKLYKLSVDTGEDSERTICAGIKQHYSKEELEGKQIIVICNLAPRKMKGIESQGMLLAASSADHTKVVLVSPEKNIDSGSKVS